MDAIAIRSELEQARRDNDDSYWRLEMRGSRITLRHITYKTYNPTQAKRGVITCFSKRARGRRLRRIMEIDWKSVGNCSFITLTYPDDCARHTMEERKTHRYLFHRWCETVTRRRLPCIWRVEWEDRKSGKFKGQFLPHMHLMYLTWLGIKKRHLRNKWESIIGAKQFTQVKNRTVGEGSACSMYIAKYCSKEANESYLDKVPKRNRTGRHAGELRSKLIPLHPLTVQLRINEAMVRFLRQRASDTLWYYDPRYDEGFTILGQEALDLIRDIDDISLDVFRWDH